jgi:hypothetical protein
MSGKSVSDRALLSAFAEAARLIDACKQRAASFPEQETAEQMADWCYLGASERSQIARLALDTAWGF